MHATAAGLLEAAVVEAEAPGLVEAAARVVAQEEEAAVIRLEEEAAQEAEAPGLVEAAAQVLEAVPR